MCVPEELALDMEQSDFCEYETLFDEVEAMNITIAANAIDLLTDEGVLEYVTVRKLYKQDEPLDENQAFRKKFNWFYKVRARTVWYSNFYRYFEELQRGDRRCDFREVLTDLWNENRICGVQVSFVSKMLNMIDPRLPIIDTQVLHYLGFEETGLVDKKGVIKGSKECRIENAVQVYEKLQEVYSAYLETDECECRLRQFDERFPYAADMPRLKKVDFLCWVLGR